MVYLMVLLYFRIFFLILDLLIYIGSKKTKCSSKKKTIPVVNDDYDRNQDINGNETVSKNEPVIYYQ